MKKNCSAGWFGGATIALCALVAVQAGAASPNVAALKCVGEKDSAWVERQARATTEDPLFQFALEEAGPPASCQAAITERTDEGIFGTVSVRFRDGMIYRSETSPPESAQIDLTSKTGFKNPAQAVDRLKAATGAIGLHVDWSKPETKKSGDVETQTFWDPDEGANASGYLRYRGDTLVAVGFGMAL